MFTALDAEHCCACPLPDTAHKDGCSVTLWAENERLKSVEIVSLEAEVIAHVDEIERLRGFLKALKGEAQDRDDVKLMDEIDSVLAGR